MNKGLVIVIGLTIILTACTAAQNSEVLPTLAAPPTALGVEVSLSTPVATPSPASPTFTLVPTILAIDQELTKVFGDPAISQWYIDDHATAVAPMESLVDRSIPPDQLHRRIESYAYARLGFEIIEREMEVEGVESVASGQSGKQGIRFQYKYTYDIYPFDMTQRVPDTLCELKEAGFASEIKFTLEQVKTDGTFVQGRLFCLPANVVQSLNCTSPNQMNLDAIQTSPGCNYNG